MSIITKLKLDKYKNMTVINQPEDYEVFNNFKTSFSNDHDAIFIFIQTLDEMVAYTQRVIKDNLLLEKGYLYFAYPKKGNKRYETFVHRDDIFPTMKVGEEGYIGDSDIKFGRMVSMDDIFTVIGLKREKKKIKKTAPSSQCVADYEDNIKDVEALLAISPTALSFYQGLTPGYQKDWARYIFSAKQKQTRDKRCEETINILTQGFKTMNLYKQQKK